jgi:protein involved in polysaccharide export with SLBB domain
MSYRLDFPLRKTTRVILGSIASLIFVPSISVGGTVEGAALRAGDRLKIAFFEAMEIPNSGSWKGSEGAAAKQKMFYQRLDLSGEYEVEPGGTISIPVLGSVELAGQSTDSARAKLLIAVSKTMGHAGNVTVTIVQRPPVYITGGVRSPGAYPYRAGMIAIQAVALAGGVEKEQMAALARDRLTRALARKAVLLAARGHLTRIDPPARLIELMGVEGAAALIQAERRIADLREEAERNERYKGAEAISSIRDEVALLDDRLVDMENQTKEGADLLRKMEGLPASRIVEAERVSSVRRDYLDISERRSQLKLSLVQAHRRLGRAESDLKRLQVKQRSDAEAEINQVDADIAQIEASLTSSTVSASGPERSCCGTESVGLEIVRSNPTGAEVLVANDTTILEPGDVVQVTAVRAKGRKDLLRAAVIAAEPGSH